MGSQVLPLLMRTSEDSTCHSYVTIHLMLAEGVFCCFSPLSSITFPFRKSLQTLSLVLEVVKTKACTIQPFTQPLGLLSLPCHFNYIFHTGFRGIARASWETRSLPACPRLLCHSVDIAPLRPSELLYSLNSSHTPNFCVSNPKKKLCFAWPVGISCLQSPTHRTPDRTLLAGQHPSQCARGG